MSRTWSCSVQEQAPARVDYYVESVFLALWRDHANIESPQVIAGLLNTVMDEITFDAGAWDVYVQEAGLRALSQAYAGQDQGVSFAPTFYLGTEPFQGACSAALDFGETARGYLIRLGEAFRVDLC